MGSTRLAGWHMKRIVPQPFQSVSAGYAAYLQSAHWRNTRNSALALAGYRCTRCGATSPLEVHHRHYLTVGRENIKTDLCVLCSNCHAKEHALVGSDNGREGST